MTKTVRFIRLKIPTHLKREVGFIPRSGFHQGSVKFLLVRQIALAPCYILLSVVGEKCSNSCILDINFIIFRNLEIYFAFISTLYNVLRLLIGEDS